jgi:hypothetical protein
VVPSVKPGAPAFIGRSLAVVSARRLGVACRTGGPPPPRKASQSKLPPRVWLIPFQCPDGSTAADGRLIVETDNFIEAGTTPDPNPPLRVGFVGLCPDGTFSWGFVRAAPTQFDPDLKNVSVSGTFADVRDNRGVLHTVSVDGSWTGTGPIITTVNGPGSKRRERSATATATIVFDGNTLVDGAANFPFPPPFIRVDTEK